MPGDSPHRIKSGDYVGTNRKTNKKGPQQILLKTLDFKWCARQDSNLRPTD